MTSDSEHDGRKGGGGAGSPGTDGCGPVLLVTVYDPMEADIIVGRLRSAGIETYVRHDALSVVYGLTVDGAGQQDIMVREADLADARFALEQTP